MSNTHAIVLLGLIPLGALLWLIYSRWRQKNQE